MPTDPTLQPAISHMLPVRSTSRQFSCFIARIFIVALFSLFTFTKRNYFNVFCLICVSHSGSCELVKFAVFVRFVHKSAKKLCTYNTANCLRQTQCLPVVASKLLLDTTQRPSFICLFVLGKSIYNP